jgi:hypothetical protein
LSFLLLFILEGEKERESGREKNIDSLLWIARNIFSNAPPRPCSLLLSRTDKTYADWVSRPQPEVWKCHTWVRDVFYQGEDRAWCVCVCVCVRVCVCVCVHVYAHVWHVCTWNCWGVVSFTVGK